MTVTSTLTDINGALAVISTELPIALAAYNILKAIWLATNPGKTEADFRAYLQTTSQRNVDDTVPILTAAGLVEDPPGSGNWHKPTVPPTS